MTHRPAAAFRGLVFAATCVAACSAQPPAPAAPREPAPAPEPAAEPATDEPDPAWGKVEILRTPDATNDITEARLGNGLRILVQELHDVPVVSTFLWYRVGSGHEQGGITGLAHYLEHLLFKGTGKLKKGEIDAITLKNGGENNAFTWRDFTAYYFRFASDRWEVALEIEADRMRNTAFDPKEFAAEKQVVLEELKIDLDSPTGRLDRAMDEKIFAGLPYGHHTLGTLEDVQDRVTRDEVKAFYDRYYWPCNATMVVAGDVQTARVLERIAQLFGKIAPGEPTQKLPETRPAAPDDARIEMKRPITVPRATIYYPTCRTTDPEDPVLDVIQRVLSGGRSSRLYRRLVDTDRLAVDVQTSNQTGKLPGLFIVSVEPQEGADLKRLEAVLGEEIGALATAEIPAEELRKAKNQIVAAFVFGKETAHDRASALGQYDTVADYRYVETYVPRIEAVTAAQVKQVAAKWLVPANRLTGWVLPDGSQGGGGEGGGGGGHRQGPRWRKAPSAAAVTALAGPALDVKRFTLANGLRLFVARRTGAPIVAVRAYVDLDRRAEPEGKAGLATLTGDLLLAGTPTRTSQQIADAIESVGGELDADTSGLHAKVRTPDLPLALDLVADVLQRAAFPADEFDKKKTELLSRIASEQDTPRTLAYLAAQAMAYGAHPYAQPANGTTASVNALTRDDVLAYWSRRGVPANTVLSVVGDVDPEALKAAVEKALGAWPAVPVAPVVLPAPVPQDGPRTRFITRADDEQLNIFLVRVGVRRSDPDWYALLVMDYVLGTGPGFTDRLSKILRDELGYAYSVGARMAERAGVEPGLFVASIGTTPKNKLDAIYRMRYEIARIRDELVPSDELEAAKAYLTGRFVFQTETRQQIAAHLVDAVRFGLPDDYLQRFPSLINAITSADVRRVARKWLHPDNVSLVICGKVDAEGLSLDPPPAPGK